MKNKINGKGASRVITNENLSRKGGKKSTLVHSPPEITLEGDNPQIVDLVNTEPVLYILGENPHHNTTSNGELYFHLGTYNTVPDEIAQILKSTENISFYIESDFVKFLEGRGVTLSPINNIRQDFTQYLGYDYATANIRNYVVTFENHTGVLRSLGVTYPTYNDAGALAYDFTGQPLTVSKVTTQNATGFEIEYSITDRGHTVTKTRVVLTAKDSRIQTQISVPVSYALFKLSGSMTVVFPEDENPDDYNILWEQLDLGNGADIAVIDDIHAQTINITTTDYKTKKFRVYINKGLPTEHYVDQFLYHSPIENPNIRLDKFTGSIRQDFKDRLGSKTVNGWIGLGLGVETADFTYNNGTSIGSDSVVVIDELPLDMQDSIDYTSVYKKNGDLVVTYPRLRKEIYGLDVGDYYITYTGIYYGQELNIIIPVNNAPVNTIGYAERLQYANSKYINAEMTDLQQSTLTKKDVEDQLPIGMNKYTGVTTQTALQQSTLRQLEYNDSASYTNSKFTYAEMTGLTQQSNTNIG